jgi:hypothetical protein
LALMVGPRSQMPCVVATDLLKIICPSKLQMRWSIYVKQRAQNDFHVTMISGSIYKSIRGTSVV